MRAADRSGIRWLLAELPELVASGVIGPETAESLRQHYSEKFSDPSRRFGFVLSAILGSLLVGAGIILLVAHNWDFLSRPVRCAIGFTPLVLSQALAVFVLLCRKESAAWRETAALLNIAAIGTAIALVSQTYQIQGNFARFILVWMLLALPVVYLFRTSLGLAAYFFGAMAWVLSSKGGALSFFLPRPNDLWVWPLLGLAVPVLVSVLRENRRGYGILLALTALAIAAAFSLGQTDDIGARSFWRCSFAGYWIIIYLVGADLFRDWRATRPHPFVTVGWIGILGLTIYLSFRDNWRTHQWQSAVDSVARHYPDALAVGIQVGWVVSGLFLAAWPLWKRREFNFIPAAALPVVAGAWAIAKWTRNPLLPSLLLNFYLLALGVVTLLRGIRAGRAFEANLGMLVIASLAFARFFDSDFEFFIRGIAFITIGLGFLVTNLVVFKRKARP
jgi:uncharacterized membrane protein